jgi:3-mercaptopyruvate sulfurtransferase SseA
MKNFFRKFPVFVFLALLLLTQACSAPTPAATAYPNPYPNPTPATAESVVRVSLADAKSAFDAKTAVFLDVRDTGSYAEAHIPGALNIPLNELEARLGELDPNAWIIPYCT